MVSRTQSGPVEKARGRTIVIEPSTRNEIAELFAFREVFRTLTWRDTSVKYKQTLLGISWIFLRPLLTIVIFTVVFGNLANLPTTGGIPYALIVCAGLLPWYLISLSLNDAANSLVTNAGIITKVYFPRLILPISAIFVNLIDFAITLVILLALFAWYGVMPAWQTVFAPLFVVLALFAVLGPSLLFAALNVRYRDFRYIVPYIIQVGLYISPVAFSTAIVPEQWRFIFSLNPAVGIIEGFRWSLFGDRSPLYWPAVMNSVIFSVLLLWIGLAVFRRSEKHFIDVI